MTAIRGTGPWEASCAIAKVASIVADARSVRAAPHGNVVVPEQVALPPETARAAADRPDRLDRRHAVALSAGGGVHFGLQLGQRPRPQFLIIGEHLHGLQARLSSSTAYRLEARMRASRSAIVPSSRSARRYRGGAQRLRHLAERQQAVVGWRLSEPAEHRRQQLTLNLSLSGDTLAERRYVAQRGRRIRIAECSQPIEGRVGGQPEFRGWDLGHRVEAAVSRRAARAAGVPAGPCGAGC